MDLEARRSLLEAAGLTVLDSAWAGEAPEPMKAWRPIIRGGATPDVRIHALAENLHFSEVQDQWVRLSEEIGIFGDQGDFLISVAGAGAANAPWARVQRTSSMRLAQQLGSVDGEPEFVAMSLDGRVSCGVTTEEYEVWILTALIE
ncbi:hypothetical protein JHN63_12440 [Streptomyces sp. MBT65]|uniref:hypothetical protein n=1 Tax=Streptomyces sp. MBT65 TaxID=1488395 RepID=UPI00190C22D6|nr:hypothetical protein [Streptomyces sp. MBT65]MBK3574608.1 hypothetical protein [Streptomyces sp. MBT65]